MLSHGFTFDMVCMGLEQSLKKHQHLESLEKSLKIEKFAQVLEKSLKFP